MGIKSNLARATVLSLTAGSLVVGGLGVSPAFADGGAASQGERLQRTERLQRYTDPTPATAAGNQNTNTWQWPDLSWQQHAPTLVAAANRAQVFGAAWPYFGQYYAYNLPQYLNAGTVAIDTAEEAAIIAAASDVLGLPAQNLVAALAQGQSLTQIAASRGIGRADFLNALNNAIQARIGAAIAAGAVTPAAGLTLLYSLNAQVNASIDQAGFPVAQASALNVWYQIFS